MQMQPNFWRFACYVFGALAVATVASYFLQGWYEGHWWTTDYLYSLAIPIVAAPIFIWFAFVPKTLEVSEGRLSIQFPFRAAHEIGWNELKYWGFAAHGTFLLQFKERATFQLLLFAFPSSQRQYLVDFLVRRFPECKARLWLGTLGFRW